jgi:hypothetical protein
MVGKLDRQILSAETRAVDAQIRPACLKLRMKRSAQSWARCGTLAYFGARRAWGRGPSSAGLPRVARVPSEQRSSRPGSLSRILGGSTSGQPTPLC